MGFQGPTRSRAWRVLVVVVVGAQRVPGFEIA